MISLVSRMTINDFHEYSTLRYSLVHAVMLVETRPKPIQKIPSSQFYHTHCTIVVRGKGHLCFRMMRKDAFVLSSIHTPSKEPAPLIFQIAQCHDLSRVVVQHMEQSVF